jgi:hypothetical protein
LALAACLGLGCALAVGPARADGAAAVPAQSAESETVRPPQADDEPFEDEIVPPSGQGHEKDDEGEAGQGCPFMGRPLDLIV